MEISDYIKELDKLKDYTVRVNIPMLGAYYFRGIGGEKRYQHKNFPNLGRSFAIHLFKEQIPTFEEYKAGRDNNLFGVVID